MLHILKKQECRKKTVEALKYLLKFVFISNYVNNKIGEYQNLTRRLTVSGDLGYDKSQTSKIVSNLFV